MQVFDSIKQLSVVNNNFIHDNAMREIFSNGLAYVKKTLSPTVDDVTSASTII